MSLSVIDLFSGAGGFSEGFSLDGRFRTICAVENDLAAAASYKANHTSVEVFLGDITDWISGDVPYADVVVGGPPCQGFSNLGRRRVRDPRNALWRRYVEALVAIRPKFFVLENVADFLQSGQFRDLKRETYCSGRLREYRIVSGVLNAACFGAAQVRRRAVVIGSLRDEVAVGLPEGCLRERENWTDVRTALAGVDHTVIGIDLPTGRTEYEGKELPGLFKSEDLHLGRRPTQLSLDRYASIPAGGNRMNLPDHLLSDCWRRHKSGSADVMGRLHWDRPSVTIRTEFWKPEKGRYLHPEANRPLTHYEAALLQGFGTDYLWAGSKAEIAKQIGNAVPVRLASAIAGHIADFAEMSGAVLAENLANSTR